MTESRKIQEIRGSYYLYLPKSWCVANQIKKNQEISIDILEDNTLLLTNKVNIHPLTGKISINLDEFQQDNTDIFHLIFSCYICGADEIIIKSNKKIKLQLRQEIDQTVRDLIDLEVFDEDENSIVIKSIGQTYEDIKSIFKRTINNVLFMLEQLSGTEDILLNSSKNNDNTLNTENVEKSAKTIISRYNNVKRFSSFIERGIHILLRDRNLIRKLNWTASDCIFNLIVTKYAESIGGHCSKMATLLTKLDKYPNIIQDMAKKAYQIYKDSIIVYQYGNMFEAYKIFHNHHNTNLQLDKIQSDFLTEGNLMLYHLQRVINYSKKIAELAIHKFISKTVASSRKHALSRTDIINKK
ncbi:MAG: hypothetical protein ACTSYZ_14995 [Candidatus Helarchaeota archaeon]